MMKFSDLLEKYMIIEVFGVDCNGLVLVLLFSSPYR